MLQPSRAAVARLGTAMISAKAAPECQNSGVILQPQVCAGDDKPKTGSYSRFTGHLVIVAR